MQMIAVGTLIGGLAVVGSRIATQSKTLSARNRDLQSMTLLKNNASAEHQDPGAWVNAMRKKDVNIASCLSLASAGPWTCPTSATTFNVNVTDAWVSARAAQTGWNGRRIFTLSLWDVAGFQIAGTEANPLLYNPSTLSGLAGVTANSNFRYQASGYMIVQNSSGNPGNILVIRKISLTSATANALKGGNAARAVYDEIDVGMDWKNPGGTSLPVGSIVPYVGATPPGNACPPAAGLPFLFANGCASVSAANYPQLCGILGTGATSTWGAAAAGFCKLPNLEGYFLRGATASGLSQPSVLAQQGGNADIRDLGTLDFNSKVPPHLHSVSASLSSLSANGSATVAPFAISASFGGGWGQNTAYGGGNSMDCPGGWAVPCGGTANNPIASYPSYSIGVLGVATVPISIATSSGNFTSGSFGSAVGGFGVTETRPTNVQMNYLIRADY